MTRFANLLDAVARGMDWSRPRASWPVRQGNDIVVMGFDRQLAQAAQIGDRIEVADGGHVEKIATTGWLQWKFVAPEAKTKAA